MNGTCKNFEARLMDIEEEVQPKGQKTHTIKQQEKISQPFRYRRFLGHTTDKTKKNHSKSITMKSVKNKEIILKATRKKGQVTNKSKPIIIAEPISQQKP